MSLFELLPASLAFLCLFSGCPDSGVNPPTNPLGLTIEDVSCTEVFLKLSLAASETQRTLALKRGDSTLATITMRGEDSLFVDEGLLPSKTYRYTLTAGSWTATAQATTMGTTSHNFTWQIDTLGDGGGSVLYDVAIINDTLAYAVGEIYKRDSVGNWDPLPYNLVKWNGQRWELVKVTVQTRWGAVTAPIRGIFAFSADDIWLVSGDAIHGDGRTWTNYDVRLLTGNDMVSVDKAWGSNSSNMYFVGWNGTIIHYDGVEWRRIESGTTLPIWDIFGAKDERSGQYEIICVASNHSYPEGRKLLSIQGTNVTALPDSGLPWSIDAIWHVPSRKYIVVGDSVWNVNQLGTRWRSIGGLPNLYTTSIAGNALNNIIIGGAFWNLLHFNGSTWRSYFPFTSGALGSVAITGNLVIAVGYVGNRGVAIRGIR